MDEKKSVPTPSPRLQDELERAGAYRVHKDPADLLAHLDELGVRSADLPFSGHAKGLVSVPPLRFRERERHRGF